jgi:hypothetical protein
MEAKKMRRERFQGLATGVAMIIAGPAMLVAYFTWPSMMADGAGFVTSTVETGHGWATTSLIFSAVYFAAAVIAVIGLLHVLREQTSTVGDVGVGLTITGLVLTAASTGMANALVEVSFADIGSSEKAAIVDATMGSLTTVVLYAGPLLTALGTAGLGYALYAAGTIHKVFAVLLGSYGTLLLVGYATATRLVVIAGFAVLTISLIPVGFTLMARSAQQTEHTRARKRLG